MENDMSADWTIKLQTAGAIARSAGRIALELFHNRSRLTTELKGPQDFVSVADRSVEEFLRQRLAETFPEDGVLGEELGGAASERFWLIDPIDGTGNFLRGFPVWCIVLAYIVEGRTALAIVYDPNEDALYLARRGGGATRNGHPMRARPTTAMTDATICVGYSPRRSPDHVLGFLEPVAAQGAMFNTYGSCALALTHVADGRLDAFYEVHVNAWDCVAALLLIEEAGGRGNDFLAGEGLANGNTVLGCSAGLWPILAPLAGLHD